MACDACKENLLGPVAIPVYNPGGCGTGCEDNNCNTVTDSSCVVYTGPGLVCSGSDSNICLETVLQKMDEKICDTSASNSFEGFELDCIRETYPVTTMKEFAEGMAAYLCNVFSQLTSFINDTYSSDKNSLQSSIDSINYPAITGCEALNITESDSLNTVLGRLAIASCDIYQQINPTDADWSKCFTLSGTPPQTITQGFNKVLEYLCTFQQRATEELPVFNNTGTCLPNPLASESLFDTVIKIRDRLCITPTFTTANLLAVDSCVTIKDTDSLENVITTLLGRVTNLSLNTIRDVDTSFFSLISVDPLNPCLGKKLSLQASINDRLVAVNATDHEAGTLSDKLLAGTGIAFDLDTTPGKMLISATIPTDINGKVKIRAEDPQSGYLAEKIKGSVTNGIKLFVTPDSTDNKIEVSGELDYYQIAKNVLNQIEEDPDLKAMLCALVASCPSPCQPPTNVQIIPA